MPRLYAGGVRLAPICSVCGEPSAVNLDAIGDVCPRGGECGLCDGVEGTERALTEVGEILEVELLAIRVVCSLLLNMVSGAKGR